MSGSFGGDAQPASGFLLFEYYKNNATIYFFIVQKLKNVTDNGNCSLGVVLPFLSGKKNVKSNMAGQKCRNVPVHQWRWKGWLATGTLQQNWMTKDEHRLALTSRIKPQKKLWTGWQLLKGQHSCLTYLTMISNGPHFSPLVGKENCVPWKDKYYKYLGMSM